MTALILRLSIVLTEEERRLFDTFNKNPVAYRASLVAANTTARGCELKGLRLTDVDLTARSMTVRRVTTKSDADTRVRPLDETAAFALDRLMERAGLGANQPEHYILPALNSRR